MLPRIKTSNFLPLLLSALFLFAVATPLTAQEEKEPAVYMTEEGTEYKVIGWESDVIYNPHTFTWIAWEEPILEKQKTKTVKPVPISEFERPPVFDAVCLDASAAEWKECTNRELQEYIEMNVEYPDRAQNELQEGMEYVTFVLTAEGKIENISLLSKGEEEEDDEKCKPCADAAADLVAGMEDKWYPAIKDNKKVDTKLTIPIRFNLIGEEDIDIR